MTSAVQNISDEPVTPAGRLFLRPEMDTIIHCALGFKHHSDIDTIKTTVKNSLMVKHPRFTSLLVRDKNGFEHWRKTEIEIDRHIIIVDTAAASAATNGGLSHDDDGDAEKIINDYIADLLVSTPLSFDKPLWEIHMMVKQKCLVLRFHHALGDGISLMSMFLTACRKANDPEAMPTLNVTGGGRRDWKGKKGKNWREVLMVVLKMIFFSFVFCLEFILRSLVVRDRKTVISGGDGVELWPRKVATAKFLVEDMKAVKNAVSNATINDVLFGIISAGLSRYLDHRSPKSLKEGQQLTGIAMVNLRKQTGLQEPKEMMKSSSTSRWGNKFGMMLLPVHYQNIEPLQYVKRAKTMIDRKKQTLEAHFSYQIGDLVMSLLGSKVAWLLNYRIMCHTTFTISNVIGPKEEITIAGNPITFIRATTSSLPQAVAMHMVSYGGRADMLIVVAKDIIPDPEFLAKCFEDSLIEMKEAAALAMI